MSLNGNEAAGLFIKKYTHCDFRMDNKSYSASCLKIFDYPVQFLYIADNRKQTGDGLMSVTLDDVKKIAALAYLEFEPAELQKFTNQMNQILGYVEKLNELDTADTDITYHPIEYPDVFREDEITEGLTVDQALQNAPEKSWQYFVVPKVIT